MMQSVKMAMRGVFGLAAAAAILAAPAAAGDNNGNFMIRLQGTSLTTVDKTNSATSSNLGDIKALGYTAETSNSVLPTATLTYFFNKNVSAELFCCFAKTRLDLLSNGAKAGQVADTWLFPPALTLQYHFTDLGAFKPYVGAGAQWIHYFATKTGDNYLGADSARLTDSFGPVLQAGFDVAMGNGWYLNADVKKSWLDTKVSFANARTLNLQNVDVKHSIDPVTVSLGIGYRFNLDDMFGRARAEPMK